MYLLDVTVLVGIRESKCPHTPLTWGGSLPIPSQLDPMRPCLFQGILKWVLPQDGILTPKASVFGTQLRVWGKVMLYTLAGSHIPAMLNLWNHTLPPIWEPPLGAWPTASRSISVLGSDLCSVGPACSEDPHLLAANPADLPCGSFLSLLL